MSPATWAEVVARFGQTPERQRLLVGLRAALDLLAACGCRRAWLDGSFVTDVETTEGRPPGDFDLRWDGAGVDPGWLGVIAPALHPLRPERVDARRQFGGDCFLITKPHGLGAPEMLGFFQQDRDGRTKGVILLALAEMD